MKKVIVLFLFFNILSNSGISRDTGDYEWWIKIHQWDGYTPWLHMITTTAKYFGPNALPVPQINEARISSTMYLKFRPEMHLSQGDNTFDLYSSFKAPIGKRADIHFFMVPVEYFSMDTITRDERFVRHRVPKGFAAGDLWFGTNIQLVKDHGRWPDMVLSLYCKTASGGALEWARYTDTPGYSFLVAFGKKVYKNDEKKSSFRIFGHGGLFVYQTWSLVNPQMDAIAYGIGGRWERNNFYLKGSFAGYWGYWGTGDRPSVVRINLGTQHKKVNWGLYYQGALYDTKYQSFGISTTFVLKS